MPARKARITAKTRAPKGPRITTLVNDDIDWTPLRFRIRPRIVRVTGKSLLVEIEEASPMRPGDKRVLCLGVWGGDKPVAGLDHMWLESSESQIEELIDLLTRALRHAKKLGLPRPTGPDLNGRPVALMIEPAL